MDFWVMTTLQGYIIEFSVDNHKYFSKVESVFQEEAKRRLLWEISLWIKIFLVE